MMMNQRQWFDFNNLKFEVEPNMKKLKTVNKLMQNKHTFNV